MSIIVDLGGVLIPNTIVVVVGANQFDDVETYVAQLEFVKGDKGDPGDPGGGSYKHVQSVAANIWSVNHELGFYPGGILIKDSGGMHWIGEVTHIDINNLTIDFGSSSFGGIAYIS